MVIGGVLIHPTRQNLLNVDRAARAIAAVPEAGVPGGVHGADLVELKLLGFYSCHALWPIEFWLFRYAGRGGRFNCVLCTSEFSACLRSFVRRRTEPTLEMRRMASREFQEIMGPLGSPLCTACHYTVARVGHAGWLVQKIRLECRRQNAAKREMAAKSAAERAAAE